MFEFSADAGLAGLFVASFLAATLLPGGSEIALVVFANRHPESVAAALWLATAGNTLGGMSSYLIGRLLPNRAQAGALAKVRRYGVGALLLSWLPLVGDALCVAAGWLRMNPWQSLLAIGVGKLARYVVVLGAWNWLVVALR